MRYFLAKENSREVTPRLQQTLQYEKDQNLDNIHSYLDFAEKCSMRKNELFEIINNFKKEGKKIIGYGATSKSTTILNYCGLSKDHIDYIVDNTPTKIDKRTPITDIPIKDRDFFLNDKNVDAIVLFAWNHAKEIMLKESKFTSDGGIWIDIGENIGVIDDPVCKS